MVPCIINRHSFLQQVFIEHLLCARAGKSIGNEMHSCSPRAHRLEGRQRQQVGTSLVKGVIGQLREYREGLRWLVWDLRGGLPGNCGLGWGAGLEASKPEILISQSRSFHCLR